MHLWEWGGGFGPRGPGQHCVFGCAFCASCCMQGVRTTSAAAQVVAWAEAVLHEITKRKLLDINIEQALNMSHAARRKEGPWLIRFTGTF